METIIIACVLIAMGVFTVWSILYTHACNKNNIFKNLKEYEKKKAKQQKS